MNSKALFGNKNQNRGLINRIDSKQKMKVTGTYGSDSDDEESEGEDDFSSHSSGEYVESSDDQGQKPNLLKQITHKRQATLAK